MDSNSSGSLNVGGSSTYKPPSYKIPIRPNLRSSFRCKLKITLSSKQRITTSNTRSREACVSKNAEKFIGLSAFTPGIHPTLSERVANSKP